MSHFLPGLLVPTCWPAGHAWCALLCLKSTPRGLHKLRPGVRMIAGPHVFCIHLALQEQSAALCQVAPVVLSLV